MNPLSSSRGAQMALFAKNFLKHPAMLGSVIPSSRFLIERLLKQVDFARARVIVEYGPGVGTITREILKRMRPDAVLIVLETNPDFVRFLKRSVHDPRLRVVHESAATVERALAEQGVEHADYVISGIPFSTLPGKVREDVLRATHAALGTTGVFLVYQFSPKVLPDLRRIFRRVQRSFEPLNVLPAVLFYCTP
jgi:phospholipid N-methyltransferase